MGQFASRQKNKQKITEEEEKGISIPEFKFKHDLLLLWVPEEGHFLWNTQSPLKTKEMAFLKNANIASTSLTGI